ncbi:hypothetical protein RN001_007597 [Aquatica leii]|uniref:Uncharacterized protein n=1 Tax=Aquatica leii TaxID=1421715 RepID=A0AAN7S967_9COLE|nr:hypothetical protein RN001_007597 [Aquatica leii]
MEATSEEIPAETVVSLTKKQIQTLQMKKHQEKRILRLFISHFLDPVKVQFSSERESYYQIGDIVFKKIQVRGVITGINVTFKTNETHIFSIDDGTGTLDCFLIDDDFLENLRVKTQNDVENNVALLQQEPQNSVYRAALMMRQSSKDKFKKFLPRTEFSLGDTVVVIGKLSEYKGKRNCFIQSICKVDPINNSDYYEDLCNLYKTVYNKHINFT